MKKDLNNVKYDAIQKYFFDIPKEIKKIMNNDLVFDGFSFFPSYRPMYYFIATNKLQIEKLSLYEKFHEYFPSFLIRKKIPETDIIFYDALSYRKLSYFGSLEKEISKKNKIVQFQPSDKEYVLAVLNKNTQYHHPIEFINNKIKKETRKAIGKKHELFEKKQETFESFLGDLNPNKKNETMKLIETSYKSLYPLSLFHYLEWGEIINKLNPKIVILDDVFGMPSYSAILACKNKSIITIGIQHGIGLPEGFKYKLKIKWPDILFVWSKKTKNELEHIGKNKIYDVGPLRYDDLPKSKIETIEDSKILFWPAVFTKANDGLDKKIFSELCVFLDNNKKWGLLIKSHPEFGVPQWLKQHINNRKIKIIDKHINSFKVIKSSDLVLAYNTTVFLEANIAKKPTIFYKQSGCIYEMAKEYGFPIVNDASKIDEIFENNSENIKNARERYLRENISNLGCASKKAYEIISDILDKTSR